MATVMTVRGAITPSEFGRVLAHEHVMVDFVGADQTGPHRWDADEVHRLLMPLLLDVKKRGFDSFVDCTPAYIGRDVELLRRCSEDADLHILTTTGWYKEPYLPARAFTQTVDEIADEWTREVEHGIDGTDIYPGFIKIAVNAGSLIDIQRKIVRAAALTHKRTGLAIACHTGHGIAARETVELLIEEQVDPGRYIFVHAESEADREHHKAVADAGGWVEYDAVGWRPTEFHVELLTWAREQGMGPRLLLSQDSGWYHVGEENGGDIRPFTYLSDDFIPAATEAGIPPEWIEELLTTNAQAAYAYPG